MEYEKEIELDEEGHLRAYINYRNVDRIYTHACDMHGKDNMSNYRTWVYNLSSPRRIAEIIKNGGEYIMLKYKRNAVGLVNFSFGVCHRPLDNPDKTLTIDEWEIGGLLIHRSFRGKGFSKNLFKLSMERLKDKKGAIKVYVVVTGTFNRERLGEPREKSKPVMNLCKRFNGRIIGYARDSFGPIFELSAI